MAELPRELAGLMQASAFPHEVHDIELIETHISWVVLTGEFAYKIKRPVVYPFVDLRSPERRAFYCAEELRLNRRFAPDLYLEVCEIREDQGVVTLNGPGRCIEHCVKMRQFPRDQELDRLLAAGKIEPASLERFGGDLADIHATLPVAGAGEPWGSAERVRRAMLENLDQYTQAAAPLGYLTPPTLRPALESRLDALTREIDSRRRNGRVRECHGDLHTRNVVHRDSRLVGFDCMEFEPAFRWIDVAEEVALLLADLRARGFPRHAHAFLSGYLARSGDYQACRVLDLYQAHRALVRGKVAAVEASNAVNGAVARAREHHDAQIEEARSCLAKKDPELVLIGGLSGSGKTWLARRLAPDIDAVHLRSDVERKRLAGLDEYAQSKSGTATGLYTAENTAHLYKYLAMCAEHVLSGGHSAIVDATFLMRAQRTLFSDLARQMSVRIQMILCDAPVELLRKRIIQRQKTARDASEADLAVLAWQIANQDPVAASESLRLVKVSTGGPDPVDSVLSTLHAKH